MREYLANTGTVEVLVLLATYNGGLWLEEQLRTIFDQRNVRVRVVASDDGSLDDTIAILERAESRYDLRLLGSWPGAGCAAGNFGRLISQAPLARADFVAFADQDDTWDADKLARAVTALERTGSAGYSSRTLAVWPDGRSRVVGAVPNHSPGDFFFEGAGQGCTFVMRRAAFELARAAVERHASLSLRMTFHDWMIYVVFRAMEMPWFFDPKPSLRYRQHQGNALGSRGGWASTRRRLALMRTGWLRAQLNAAFDLAQAVNPRMPELERFAKARLAGGIKWFGYLAFRSRRRRSDRLVLVAAALLGWLR